LTASVLVIGLDAAEATLIERWAGTHYLPTFFQLVTAGASVWLDNPMETLPGAIWPEICTGRSGGKTALFYHGKQIHSGEAVPGPVSVERMEPLNSYWSVASEAGCRVCVVDQVQAPLIHNLNGLQVVDWGSHDVTFETSSHPENLLDELTRKYGRHAVQSCDHYAHSHSGKAALLSDLLDGMRRKRMLMEDLMGREHWDLFTCTLSETHCAGHQLWHYFDQEAPDHDPQAPPALRDGIATIYREIDKTIGALMEAAGKDAQVLVVASHGMGPARAGYQLLPEFLVRLGMGSNGKSGSASLLRSFQAWIKKTAPRFLVPTLEKLTRAGPVKAILRRSGGLLFPLESRASWAAAVENNRVGAIRLNLHGREPNGCIQPGEQANAVLSDLQEELLALEDPANGEPLVERVVRADEAFGPDHHPDVPDLMVVFRPGQGRIEAARSPRAGTFGVPYHSHRFRRTGDHTVHSKLWAVGPAMAFGTELPRANVLDIAPTVLSLLGVAQPKHMSGQPILLARQGNHLDED
jgi:predicted AlkP superfamily phosphohydrolase/phosphomutase